MSRVFDVGGAIVAVTPGIFKIKDNTDNPTYGPTNTALPTGNDYWLNGFTVTTDAACKVEVGLTNTAKSSFVPVYATYATEGTGGGIVRDFTVSERPVLVASHATINLLAVRITVAADATVHIAGDISIGSRA